LAVWHWSVKALGLAFLLIAALSSSALAVTSNELVERADKLNKQYVSYQGEVIGDVMRRGRQAVVNVSDGRYAIGVWLASRDADEIRYAGRSGVKGDIVEVVGTFHQACTEHGGDMDIHAERLQLVSSGRLVEPGFRRYRAVLASALLVASAVLVEWERRRRQSAAVDEA
jgi:opacity protein-like surface antigen